MSPAAFPVTERTTSAAWLPFPSREHLLYSFLVLRVNPVNNAAILAKNYVTARGSRSSVNAESPRKSITSRWIISINGAEGRGRGLLSSETRDRWLVKRDRAIFLRTGAYIRFKQTRGTLFADPFYSISIRLLLPLPPPSSPDIYRLRYHRSVTSRYFTCRRAIKNYARP